MQDLVVVVPCFNEERRFPSASFIDAARVDSTLSFVFVDDGSTDGTRSLLEGIRSAEGDQFSVLALDENGGKAEAVRRGMLYAFERSPSLVGYLDADLATPLIELGAMRALFFEHPDLHAALGSRVALLGRHVVRRPTRHYFGRLFASLASLSLGVTVYDTQCGAKVFRNTAAVRSIFSQRFATRWTFDVEILARLRALSSEGAIAPLPSAAAEVPLSSWRDVSGSKVGPLDGLRAMLELISLGLRYRQGWQREEINVAYRSAGPAQRVRASGVVPHLAKNAGLEVPANGSSSSEVRHQARTGARFVAVAK